MFKIYNEELDLFYLLDQKKYLVSENEGLKNWMKIADLHYEEQDIQNFIDKLAAWYFVKLPDKLFDGHHVSYECFSQKLNVQMTLEVLFQKLTTTELDFFNFGDEDNKCKETFCQYLLQMAGYEILYYKKSLPHYNINRVNVMFSEFNLYFNWKLDVNIYSDVVNRDYSLDNFDNIKLLKSLKDKPKKKKKSKLGKFLHF